MKKFVSLIILLFSFCLLTGCVKYNTSMTINSDGSMNVEIMLVTEEQEENTEDDGMNMNTDTSISEEMKDNLERYGFIVTDYNQDGYVGQVISKRINSINEVTSSTKIDPVNLYMLLGDEEGTTPPIQTYFYKQGNNYVADFIFKMTDDETVDNNMIALYDMFEITYKVTLPERSISNNAHSFSEDGKTLTWNLKVNEENPIKFEFSLPNLNNNDSDIKAEEESKFATFIKENITYIGMGLIFLLVVIVIIVSFVRKNKKENDVINTLDSKPISDLDAGISNNQNEQNVNTSIPQMVNPVIMPNNVVETPTSNVVVDNNANQVPVSDVASAEPQMVNTSLDKVDVNSNEVQNTINNVVNNVSQQVATTPILNNVINQTPVSNEENVNTSIPQTVNPVNTPNNVVETPSSNVITDNSANQVPVSNVVSVESQIISSVVNEQPSNNSVVNPLPNSISNELNQNQTQNVVGNDILNTSLVVNQTSNETLENQISNVEMIEIPTPIIQQQNISNQQVLEPTQVVLPNEPIQEKMVNNVMTNNINPTPIESQNVNQTSNRDIEQL